MTERHTLPTSQLKDENDSLNTMGTADMFPNEYEQAKKNINKENDLPNFLVSKSNRIVEAQYNLSAREQKLLAACISLINPTEVYDDGLPWYELNANEISQMTGMKASNVYSFVETAAMKFHSIPIRRVLDPKDPNSPIEIFNIAHKSYWDPKEGIFRIKFHSDMEPELIQLSEYTKYELKQLQTLRSKYAIRLYELAKKHLHPTLFYPTHKIYKLEELHFFLGVSNSKDKGKSKAIDQMKKSYMTWYEFRRRVLDVAIEEVNEATDVQIEYETKKTGRSVSAVKFTFKHRKLMNLNTATIETVHNDKDGIALRLLKIVPEDISQKIFDKYSEAQITANLDYLDKLLERDVAIGNRTAFFRYLLTHDIGSLPDAANPYSHLYKIGSAEHDFVKQHIMTKWLTIPEAVQVSLQKFGLKAPQVKPYFKEFKKHHGEGSLDMFHETFQSSHEWYDEGFEEDLNAWYSSDLDW
jgi:plasmid replication initiation protein